MIAAWYWLSCGHTMRAGGRWGTHSAKGLCDLSQVSNEPGLYLEGCLGIRIENLMLVVQKAGSSQAQMY